MKQFCDGCGIEQETSFHQMGNHNICHRCYWDQNQYWCPSCERHVQKTEWHEFNGDYICHNCFVSRVASLSDQADDYRKGERP